MKAICIVASDNVVFDGDVCFINPNKSNMDCAVAIDYNKENILFTKQGLYINYGLSFDLNPYLIALWIWHMVILRKPYVYLTGVNRK